jgi:hypothetical protein
MADASPAPLCPRCSSRDTRPLEYLSLHALVDYWRCGFCTHVWTIPKAEHAQKRGA